MQLGFKKVKLIIIQLLNLKIALKFYKLIVLTFLKKIMKDKILLVRSLFYVWQLILNLMLIEHKRTKKVMSK